MRAFLKFSFLTSFPSITATADVHGTPRQSGSSHPSCPDVAILAVRLFFLWFRHGGQQGTNECDGSWQGLKPVFNVIFIRIFKTRVFLNIKIFPFFKCLQWLFLINVAFTIEPRVALCPKTSPPSLPHNNHHHPLISFTARSPILHPTHTQHLTGTWFPDTRLCPLVPQPGSQLPSGRPYWPFDLCHMGVPMCSGGGKGVASDVKPHVVQPRVCFGP